jgi:AraC family transcriptional regulator of adaptative response/methylated-DNA-[protein]-cysteine methyltransferase
MLAAASEKGLCMLDFTDSSHHELHLRHLSRQYFLHEGENPYFAPLRTQLQEYFQKQRKNFTLPLDVIGTEFQKRVWHSLQTIPYGKTMTYSAQAQFMKTPQAVRAVAAANGKNKITIILPCHRVVGSSGALTGYAGGLWRKKVLLCLELENKG